MMMFPEEFVKWWGKSEAEREADHKKKMEQMDREINEILARACGSGPPIPYPITSCTIPSPPVQQISSLQVYPSSPIVKTPIASPPIQKIVPLKAEAPFRVTESRILSPPSPKSCHIEAIPRKENHHYVSAIARNPRSTSQEALDRPSREARLISRDSANESCFRSFVFLEPQRRRLE